MDYTSQKDYNSNGSYTESNRPENGHVCTQTESRKRRPISVIGGVDLYSSPTAEQKDDTESLPSVRPFLSFNLVLLLNFCTISKIKSNISEQVCQTLFQVIGKFYV